MLGLHPLSPFMQPTTPANRRMPPHSQWVFPSLLNPENSLLWDFSLVQLTRKTDHNRNPCTKPHNVSTNEIRTCLRTLDNCTYSFHLQDAEFLIFLHLFSHTWDYKHKQLCKCGQTHGLKQAKPEFYWLSYSPHHQNLLGNLWQPCNV